MAKKVKIGLVGCGDVARRYYLPTIISSDKIDLVSVCDVVEERVKKIKEDFGAKEYYLDYSEMLQKADIEAVVILTNPKYHFSLALEAIKVGKHVYTEKTMGFTLEEVDTLIKKAEEMKVKLAAAPAVILSPVNQRIKKIIKKGLIGKVCFVCAHSSHGGPASWDNFATDPTWFYKKGAGPLYDLGVYALHTLTGILGPAKRITAFSGISIPEIIARSGVVKGKKIKVEVDDNTLLLLDFGNNTFAYVDATFCMKANRGPATVFYGSEGIITSGAFGHGPLEVYIEKEEDIGIQGWITTPETNALNWTPANGIIHFVECIIKDQKPVISAEHARHVMEIMIMAYESAKSGEAKNLTTTF
jgi:predicted dehydrogenase